MNELALFAGAGGGILGGKLLGWRTVCAVEIEPYPISVLIQRQNDGILPPFPIWDDVCTFDGKPWRGIVDVVSGGFPCQDISAAGKGVGIAGARSGLWSEFMRIIDEVRPKFAFVENSPLLRKRGLDRVLSDLAKIGYNAEWCVLGADDCSGPHKRKRIWILAYTSCRRLEGWFTGWNKDTPRLVVRAGAWKNPVQQASRILGVGDGMAGRVDRIKAIGNGQVPIVAATAWNILLNRVAEFV